jgi:hypothetical protein
MELVGLVRGGTGPIRIEIKFVLQLVGIEHITNTEYSRNSKSKHKIQRGHDFSLPYILHKNEFNKVAICEDNTSLTAIY